MQKEKAYRKVEKKERKSLEKKLPGIGLYVIPK